MVLLSLVVKVTITALDAAQDPSLRVDINSFALKEQEDGLDIPLQIFSLLRMRGVD
jgi:hypothetical protein